MGTRDTRKEEAADAPVTLSLLDAIQQTVKTREMLSEMQARLGSLNKQRSTTRQKIMLDELQKEEDLLKNSVRMIAGEFEKMARFFRDMKVRVNGKEILAEDAVRRLMNLKQHLEGLKNLTKNLDLETHGSQVMELQAALMKKTVQDCVNTWQTETVAFALLLEAVKIPDSAKDLFQSVWTDRGQMVYVYVRWDAKKSLWIEEVGSTSDPRLKQYIQDASAIAAMEGIPDGFEASIECSTDDQGVTRFNIKTNRLYGGPRHVPSSYATGSTRDQSSGSTVRFDT